MFHYSNRTKFNDSRYRKIVKLFDKTEWRPTYYVIHDYIVWDKLFEDKYFQELSNKMVADIILIEHKLKNANENIIFPFDLEGTLYNIKHHNSDIPLQFSDDAYVTIYDGFTVTYTALQLAVYMGFTEIYLLGVDCNYSGSKQHFLDFGNRITDNPEEKMIAAYKVAKKYADAHGIKIYNATRGGKLEVFERVDFDSLFETNIEDKDGTKDNPKI